MNLHPVFDRILDCGEGRKHSMRDRIGFQESLQCSVLSRQYNVCTKSRWEIRLGIAAPQNLIRWVSKVVLSGFTNLYSTHWKDGGGEKRRKGREGGGVRQALEWCG